MAMPSPSPACFAATDLCVKCGLCLPHCPTYRLSQNESESPRGRLALLQGWADGKLAATPALLAHLDSCLGCRRCETVCPAKVPYGRLLDEFRAQQPQREWLGRWARCLLANPSQRQWLARGMSRYGHSPGRRWLRRLLPSALEGLAHAATPQPLAAFYPAQGRETARVALFTGCTGDWLDSAALQAGIAVLTRLGVAVSIPPQQGCCGALHWHAGERAAAAPLLENNRTSFHGADIVLAVASGCGDFLAEHSQLQPKVMDISAFLAELAWPESVLLSPLPAHVCLHTPCSLNKRWSDPAAPAKLLGKIPDLRLTELPAEPACCGAAGTYALSHPAWAERLRDELLASIRDNPPDYLASANVGCANHWRAGLAAQGLAATQVIHPVQLLARGLGQSPP